MILIHGFNPLMETMKSSRVTVLEILVQKGKKSSRLDDAISLAYAKQIPVRFAEKRSLDHLTGGAHHQGIIGKVKKWIYEDFDEIIYSLRPSPLFVILDRVMDPHNLGAVIRSSECTGADAVIIPENHSVGVTSAVVAASAGAAAFQKICRVKNIASAMKNLKSRGIWIIGMEAEGLVPWTDIDFTLPTAIVLGEEGSGMRRLTRKYCDQTAFLPLEGHLGSINLSVTAGVILYEVLRQRRKKEGNKG